MSAGSGRSRLAGWLYLAVVVTGMFSLAYVPSRIPLGGDPAAAIARLRASEPLFRLGIAGLLLNQVAFLLLPLALHEPLRSAGKGIAAAMVGLAWASVPMALAAAACRMEILQLLQSPAIPPDQLQAAFASALRGYGASLTAASLFWGLWLAPFGYLAMKAHVLPKLLGILLLLGCLGYGVDVFGGLLASSYDGSLLSKLALLPPALGEIGTCLWLLAAGIRREVPAG